MEQVFLFAFAMVSLGLLILLLILVVLKYMGVVGRGLSGGSSSSSVTEVPAPGSSVAPEDFMTRAKRPASAQVYVVFDPDELEGNDLLSYDGPMNENDIPYDLLRCIFDGKLDRSTYEYVANRLRHVGVTLTDNAAWKSTAAGEVPSSLKGSRWFPKAGESSREPVSGTAPGKDEEGAVSAPAVPDPAVSSETPVSSAQGPVSPEPVRASEPVSEPEPAAPAAPQDASAQVQESSSAPSAGPAPVSSGSPVGEEKPVFLRPSAPFDDVRDDADLSGSVVCSAGIPAEVVSELLANSTDPVFAYYVACRMGVRLEQTFNPVDADRNRAQLSSLRGRYDTLADMDVYMGFLEDCRLRRQALSLRERAAYVPSMSQARQPAPVRTRSAGDVSMDEL